VRTYTTPLTAGELSPGPSEREFAAGLRRLFAREREERKKPQGPPRLVMSAQAMRDLERPAP
jgi:hypothetical protein